MENPPVVLLVTPDMMCASQLQGGVQAAGAVLRTVWSAAAAIPRIQAGEFQVVLLDLEAFSPPEQLATWFALLPSKNRPRILAFGPHVDQGRLQNALHTGCDAVYTRGQMHRETQSLVHAALAVCQQVQPLEVT